MNKRLILLLLLGYILATPLMSSAKNRTTLSSIPGTSVCQNLPALENQVQQTLSDRQRNFESKKNAVVLRLIANRKDKDVPIEKNRGESDRVRTEEYSKLISTAQSESERAAAIAFKSNVENAVTARRQAIDVAVQNYRTDLDRLILQEKNNFDTATNDFKNSVDLAFTNAKMNCVQNNSTGNIKISLKKELLMANQKFISSISSSKNLEERVAAIAEKQKIAVTSATTSFSKSYGQAIEMFKLSVTKR